MLDFDELRNKLNDVDNNMKKNIGHLGTMSRDAERVSNIAKNAPSVINDIDRKFEQATQLTGIDISFLFLAVALQVVRQYFVTNFKERSDHDDAAKPAKKEEEKKLGKETKEEKNARKEATHAWYRPSIEEVTFNPVPFDQIIGLKKFGVKIGGPFAHRAKTPGHDAILGYIFGTANIATATLTTWEMQSYHVKYGEVKNENVGTVLKPMITNNANTGLVFENTYERMTEEGWTGKSIIAISLFRIGVSEKQNI